MDFKLYRFVFSISLVAALGGLLFGYDWVVIGGAKFFYERYFEITDNTSLQAWAMSSALIGCIPGAMLAGYFSDRFGRKRSLILAALLFTISALGTGFTNDYSFFMFYRILGGVGIGLASSVAPIYIAEVAPSQFRGRFVSLNQLTIVVGILLAQIINYFIAEPVPVHATEEYILASWNVEMGWRWMFWAEAIPASLFLVLAFFIPESPRWLMKAGQESRAYGILKKINVENNVEKVFSEIKSSLSNDIQKIDFRVLLKRKYRKVLVIGLVLAAFQQWCGINIVFNYAETIFTQAGFGITSALFNIVITGIVNLVFTLVAMKVVDGLGRRKLMLFGSAGLFVTYIFLGMGYHFEIGGPLVLFIITVAIAIYAVSLAPVTWVLLSEIFPNKIRGAAMAAATTTLWIASSLLVLLFPIINETFGLSGAFWIYSAICLMGFLFIMSKVFETKGKSLEELEKAFDLHPEH